MRKIILASKSRARRRLLQELGIRCSVEETHVREKAWLKKGIRAVVVANAMAKARACASRHAHGVVIGADTMVCVRGRLIGKPRDLKDAMRTIATLVRNPHWVYTGIAVIDIDKGARYSDWAKTKVYMRPLTQAQIKNYCVRRRPGDYAGGFDIQGSGAGLVARIEGCFYNVVGLPLAKLLKLLEKCGIDYYGA